MSSDQQEFAETVEADQLRARYKELAELAGSLAHEIKNPLAVIRMNMDLLAEDFADLDIPEQRRIGKKIETVQRQCTRLDNLLKDFLKIASLNKLSLKPGSLNLQLEHVLDFYEADARKRRVEIVKYLDPDLPSMMLDPPALQAALLNLVKNSLESMPDGGQLVVRTRMTSSGIALDIIDNGRGIDDTTLFNMFTAFYSTKDGGSGLGLPTAKKIIEAHSGHINVQSTVGRGTQFTLEFPTPKRI